MMRRTFRDWGGRPWWFWRRQSNRLARRALVITGTPVETATISVAYDGFTVTGSGGTEPYAYSVASGAFPNGITLGSETGEVAGTPTESGTFADIVIRVTDNNGRTADLAPFTIEVGV